MLITIDSGQSPAYATENCCATAVHTGSATATTADAGSAAAAATTRWIRNGLPQWYGTTNDTSTNGGNGGWSHGTVSYQPPKPYATTAAAACCPSTTTAGST